MELEPIYGWRNFSLFKGELYLRGGLGQDWTKLSMTAKCLAGQPDETGYPLHMWPESINYGHPDLSQRAKEHLSGGVCKCGIHLWYTREQALEEVYGNVIAYCKAFGCCVEADYGIRAEKVEIVKCYVRNMNPRGAFVSTFDTVDNDIEHLTKTYKIPVERIV